MSIRTFAIIKPACLGQHLPSLTEDILHRLQEDGFGVLHQEEILLDKAHLIQHYEHHKEREFFKPMLAYLMSGTSILLVLEHEEEAVNRLRTLIGPTDPKKGKKGQIRYDLGEHSEILFQNVIHASETPEEAIIEAWRFLGEERAIECFGEDEVKRVIWEPVQN